MQANEVCRVFHGVALMTSATWTSCTHFSFQILTGAPSHVLMQCITSISPSVNANKSRAANADNIDSVLPLILLCVFPLSEYGTTRINIFPLAAAWGLYGCMATDGRAAKQWAVAAVT